VLKKTPGRSDRHFSFTAPFHPFFFAMNPISSPGRFPKLIRRLRPSFAEVEQYARLIIEHERQPMTALAACMAEAEIQIWAVRSMLGGDDGHPDGKANA